MGLFAISVLVIGVAWQIVQDRTATLNAAKQTTQQLALALEAGTIGILGSAERVAHHVGTVTLANLDASGRPNEHALDFWRDALAEVPFLHAISFIQDDGVVQSTAVRIGDESIRLDRDTHDGSTWPAFTTHLTSGTGDLFIGLPIKSFFIEDKWILPLTLPQRGGDGKLLGVVYVDIALDTFIDLFSEVRAVGKSSITVFSEDGILMFSAPLIENILGMSFAERSLFSERLPESSIGTYQSQTVVTNDPRILTYRKVADWPLVLTFDLSLSEIFAPWQQRALIYFLAALGAATVIFVLTLRLSRQFRQDESNRRMLLVREKSLEESQRLAGVGHFDRDIRTDEITWADNMYAIHGVSPSKFTPGRDTFLELVHESAKSTVRELVHHFDSPPADGHFACQIVRPKDGALRDMVYDWRVIQDREGAPIKSFGVARDVTDLKSSERMVRESEARLRDITECMSDFIWEVDEEGVVAYFESGATYPMIDVEVGVTKDENIDFEAGAGDHLSIVKAMANREPFRNLNLPLRNKQQETRWIRLSGNPRFSSDGRFLGFRGAGTDITELREQGIYEIEKNKSDALSRLAGGMAHEINNLLQPVVVYSSMGENEPVEKARRDGYFGKIFAATQQAISIVQDVLTFAREGRGMPESLHLGSALNDSLEMIKPTLSTGVNVISADLDKPVYVVANGGGVHQVLINLVRNAVDSIEGVGEVKIQVGSAELNVTEAQSRSIVPGHYGFFSVSDDGPGLNEDVISKVFDPFFSTKPTGLGTGLGLSVVAGLVKGWGGVVDVTSRPGRTTFTVYLPLVSAARLVAE